MVKYNELINDLNWNMPEETQRKAIENLIDIDEENIHLLVLPGDKSMWENAAIVLKEIGYPKIKPIISELFNWLQDMNWPGAWTVFEILKTIDKLILTPHIEVTLRKAASEEDNMWITAIKDLTKEMRISEEDFQDKETYKLLELAE